MAGTILRSRRLIPSTTTTPWSTQEVDSFLRLYMVPGMQHCGDGPGTDSFGQAGVTHATDVQHSVQLALEQWVEKSTAPSMVIATKYVGESPSTGVKMTRPLCPYPQVAKYKGAGDTNDAANFTCTPQQ
jgi:hypothetical protein